MHIRQTLRSLSEYGRGLSAHPTRLWCLAFAGFFLMIGAWAVAAPYDATADEHDHIYRAVGVVSGEIAPEPTAAVRGSGAFQTVPQGLIRPWPASSAGGVPTWQTEAPCWTWHFNLSAACAESPSSDGTPVVVGSGAGRYNPLYYALVGLPLKWWPGWTGLLLARLISGALCAALLAAAVTVIARFSRYGAMVAGLLAAVTPTSLHFMGAINPNGPEIAAGVAFFAGVIALLLRGAPASRGLLALIGICAIALATLRPTGLMYLGIAAITFFIPFRGSPVRALWQSRTARWWAAGIVTAGLAAVIWLFAMKSANLGNFTFGRQYTLGQAIAFEAERWGTTYLVQMVGQFNWTELNLPIALHTVWLFLAGSLVVFGWLFGRGGDRWRMFGIFLGGAVLPAALQVYGANTIGFITQGRYLLPMLVGLLLLAAHVMEERGLSAEHSRALTKIFIAVLLPIQFLALVWAMVRWQRGMPTRYGLGWLNPLVGNWHPVVGSLTPVLTFLAGVALFGWLAWHANAGAATGARHRQSVGASLWARRRPGRDSVPSHPNGAHGATEPAADSEPAETRTPPPSTNPATVG